ncbi:MAG TPA: hypothetical protein VF660_11980 [Actinomycetota bacterium]
MWALRNAVLGLVALGLALDGAALIRWSRGDRGTPPVRTFGAYLAAEGHGVVLFYGAIVVIPGFLYLFILWKVTPITWPWWQRRLLAIALSPIIGLWLLINAIPAGFGLDACLYALGIPLFLGLVVRTPPPVEDAEEAASA